MLISIIIPTLNEAQTFVGTLEAIRRVRGSFEVLIVDGGSRDGTPEIAAEQGFRVVSAPRGRGAQLGAGARSANGDVLWFLHADSLPPAGAVDQIRVALEDSSVVGGNFSVRFEGRQRAARFLTTLYPHLRRLGLRYGDSGIFVRRKEYEAIGGFRQFPIFEDLDLVRRLERCGRLVSLPAEVVTSSRRFEGRSFALTFFRWAALQVLYWLGVSPRILGRAYPPVRGRAASTEKSL